MHQLLPALSLEIIVIVLGVLMLFAEAFAKTADRSGLARFAIFVLLCVFGFSFFTIPPPAEPTGFWRFYQIDTTALFFKRLALITTVLVLIMSLEYRSVMARFIPGVEPGHGTGEFYSLIVLICSGLMFMASAVDFTMIFVSLELVTIGFYVLVAYMRRHTQSLEAGIKYLILGALSTGFLVYGITWVFGITGETNLAKIQDKLLLGFAEHGALIGNEKALLFGVVLIMVALGFKIAASPFHLWVPDVYQGAPTPVTAFLSVGSKAAGFIILFRVLEVFLSVPVIQTKLMPLLVILAAATLIFGNLAAIPQDNLKRLFAYSSIAHAGYLLMAVVGYNSNPLGARDAIAFYMGGYLLMTLLSFLILIIVARHSRGDDISHFNGLGKRAPFLAFAMTIALASLAGIPLTVGFLGKFLAFKSAIEGGHMVLAVIAIVAVATGFYYYFRVIAAMYWQEPNDSTPIQSGLLSRISISVLAVLIIVLGVNPKPLFDKLHDQIPVISVAKH